MDLNAVLTEVHDMFAQESARCGVTGVKDLLTWLEERAHLDTCIGSIEAVAQSLRNQQRRLSSLPPLEVVRWAQTVLCMPNLAFLELDTTGLYEDAKIIRTTVLNGAGECLLDLFAKTPTPLYSNIERITGITDQELQTRGQDIISVLTQLREELAGKYVLSYNLSFDAGKLQEATTRLHIEPIHFIGEDLMARATKYFSASLYPRLEAVCQQIGKPLPAQPDQTAIDRAKGQIALLHAIANVVTATQQVTDTSSSMPDNDLDTDEHPF